MQPCVSSEPSGKFLTETRVSVTVSAESVVLGGGNGNGNGDTIVVGRLESLVPIVDGSDGGSACRHGQDVHES